MGRVDTPKEGIQPPPPYCLMDRDLLVKTHQMVENIVERLDKFDKPVEDHEKRIRRLEKNMYTGLGVVVAISYAIHLFLH